MTTAPCGRDRPRLPNGATALPHSGLCVPRARAVGADHCCSAGAPGTAIADGAATVASSAGEPDALITAGGTDVADDRGRTEWCDRRLPLRKLSVGRNLHVGVDFLAATTGSIQPARMRFRYVETSRA